MKVVFSESSGPPLSGNNTCMVKFGGTLKWGPFLAVLAGNFAPEVVFRRLEINILTSKQTALFFPML